jgi:hypothetical protein
VVASTEITSLKLFNEKAERLLNTRFVKYIKKTHRLSVTFDFVKDQEQTRQTTTRNLPDQDAIEAFVLTFRFFIQKRETSSFRHLAKVYEKLPISPELKKSFFDWRKGLNDYLNKKVNCTIDGFTPTKRELINTFIYGGLAHADPKKKIIYDKWKANMYVYPILETHFCTILEAVLTAITNVAEINKKAIEELEKTKT